MSKAVKVGFVGAGGIAGTQISYLKKIPDVEVVALCDIREEAAQKLAQQYEVPRIFSSYKDLLKLKEINAVSVCTPNHFHCEPTIAALKAGKHVMVEKPMAMNAREAQAMVDAAKRAKRSLTIGFQWRYHPNAQMIKRAIDDGHLGKILYARCQALRRRGIPSWGVFGRKELQGGGPLIDIGVHIMEVAHYLMGTPQPVAAWGNCHTYIGNKKPSVLCSWGAWDHTTYTVEDLAVGMIRFENGSSMLVEASFAAHLEKNVFNFVLMGEKGGASFDPPAIFTDISGTMFNLIPDFVGKMDAFECKMRNWVETIRTGKEPAAPGEHGLLVQKMLDGIYRSAEIGREVRIK